MMQSETQNLPPSFKLPRFRYLRINRAPLTLNILILDLAYIMKLSDDKFMECLISLFGLLVTTRRAFLY